MKKNNGSILAIVTIFVFIFTLLGMLSMKIVVMQQSSSDAELYYSRAHFAALYASELALFNIMQWNNMPENTNSENRGGERKFLQENGNCFSYSNPSWQPLSSVELSSITNVLKDSSFEDDAGIGMPCFVERELTPNIGDGFIAGVSDSSLARRNAALDYGTYRYYVIRTTATLWNDIHDHDKGFMSQASDELHFFIVYTSGTAGAGPKLNEDYPNGNDMPNIPYYVRSSAYDSIFTGETLPIHRYYVRGRR